MKLHARYTTFYAPVIADSASEASELKKSSLVSSAIEAAKMLMRSSLELVTMLENLLGQISIILQKVKSPNLKKPMPSGMSWRILLMLIAVK